MNQVGDGLHRADQILILYGQCLMGEQQKYSFRIMLNLMIQ